MKKISITFLLTAILVITGCTKDTENKNTQAPADLFNQKIDQLVESMPITWESLNQTLGVSLRSPTHFEDGFSSSLTRNVKIGDTLVNSVFYREKNNHMIVYFKFRGTPCLSPKHFKETYFSERDPVTASTDGFSKIYRLIKPNWALGMFTAQRNGQECIMSIVFRDSNYPEEWEAPSKENAPE